VENPARVGGSEPAFGSEQCRGDTIGTGEMI
jgi:hypothetical protein